MKILTRMTDPYSASEAWVYDRFIAPAVASFLDEVDLDVPDTGRLLDVGCGGGQILARLRALHPDVELVGIDLSPNQAARARKRSGARVEVGSALDLPFDDGAFDVVLSVASIKHWPDPARGLAECRRVTRRGGRVVVVEADRGARFDDTVRFVERWSIPRALHVPALAAFRTWVAGQAFDLDDMRVLAQRAGLGATSVRRIDGTPALVVDAAVR